VRKVFALLVAFHSGFAALASAQPSPNGPQFQVNTYTPRNQEAPAVASDPEGGFVVAWHFGYGWPDFAYDVRFRRYDATGNPLGEEQRIVDEVKAGSEPAVATDGSGGFVIVWHGVQSVTSGTPVVKARRFDGDGVPLGDAFQVNTYAPPVGPLTDPHPAVVASPAGGFVVVWEAEGSPGDDNDARSIQARLFDAGGVPAGPQFQVNAYTTGEQSSPAVAMDATGKFVVVWESAGAPLLGNFSFIEARRFAADGTPLGGEFQVNVYTSGARGEPRVSLAPEGDFVVVWSSYSAPGPDDSGEGIQARRFAADGTPLGGDFLVNSYTTGNQRAPTVAMDARGEFVVAWQNDGAFGPGESNVDAQRFDATGAPLGDEFRVNTYTTNYLYTPALVVDPSGNFVVVWASNGSAGTDQDWMSVQGQRFDQLFRDGFESGDAARWTALLP
jgi:hypothetical protein